jgi:hypothetical protein
MNEETPLKENPNETVQAEREKGILVIFRFIVVPLIVVGVVVFIVALFGQVALKEKSVSDYLYDIKTGSQSERWQAAYHLSNLLANPKKDYSSEARKHLPEMISIFEKTKGSDSQIRRYLALALGRLQDPRAVPALQKAVDDEDSQTAIWAIWALGKIGDKSSTPVVLSKLESTDSSIRVMSAYILGVLDDPSAIPPLQGHLDDSSVEVTWNSALALARLHDTAGKPLLAKMMDRDYLSGFPHMDEEKKKELIINTITASTRLNDPTLDEQIKRLSSSDPSPTVRDAAMKAIQ